MSEKNLILVIGATGAQGLAVIDALLAPSLKGTPSPYAVRALTRDPDSKRAKALKEEGVECVKGSFEDFPTVFEALKGVYGAWVNTDGFTVGEAREIYAGMRIFELAKQAGTLRHYIWSSTDYPTKLGGYNPLYKVEHMDGKARVWDWIKAQENGTNESEMTYSAVSTGPYMDMLKIMMFGPITQRTDGTFVFASPIGDGHVPMIALDDIGFFARYSFDNRHEVSGKDLKVVSEMVAWGGPDGLVETFKRVTGQKAVFVRQTVDEWMNNFTNTDRTVAEDMGPGSTTWRKNFTAWWSQWRDDIYIKRDMKWIRKVNPKGYTLESWMRANKYSGQWDNKTLKMVEAGRSSFVNKDVVDKL